MKRFVSVILLAALLCPALACAGEDALPGQLTLAPGETRVFQLPFEGYWESDAPEIAQAEGNSITAHEEGSAILALVSPKGNEHLVEVTVSADPVPPVIRDAINIALREWEELGEKKIPQDPKGGRRG